MTGEERETPGSDGDDLPVRKVTASQVVAWNLARFRKAAGMTQAQMGAALGGWSVASVSAAERAWDGRRPRKFDPGEMLAVAVALHLPLSALLLPPDDDGVTVRYVLDVPGGEAGMGILVDHLVSLPPDDDIPAADEYRRAYVSAVNRYLHPHDVAGLAQAVAELGTEKQLREAGDRLGLQYGALRDVLADLGTARERVGSQLEDIRRHRDSGYG